MARLGFTVSLSGTPPPDTDILSGPMGRTADKVATFEWAGSVGDPALANLTYAFRLDPMQPAFSAFGSDTSVTYRDLDKGSYTFFVKARDQADNEDPTPASRTLM